MPVAQSAVAVRACKVRRRFAAESSVRPSIRTAWPRLIGIEIAWVSSAIPPADCELRLIISRSSTELLTVKRSIIQQHARTHELKD